jgi:hypothetical protein
VPVAREDRPAVRSAAIFLATTITGPALTVS